MSGMDTNTALCQLGRFLDEWVWDRASVSSVTVSAEDSTSAEIVAEVSLELSAILSDETEGSLDCSPSVTPDGTLELTLETGLPVAETANYDATVVPAEAQLQADGTVVVTAHITLSGLDVQNRQSTVAAPVSGGGPQNESRTDPDEHSQQGSTASSPEGSTEHSQQESTESGREARDTPPFRNPELLQEVYDSHDTFAEMADALDMDITGETVRRYMIDHDIHQPNTYQPDAGDADAASTDEAKRDTNPPAEPGHPNVGSPVGNRRGETDSPVESESAEPVVVSDGLGLPEEVDVEELIETVSTSNTIYEVKEDLGLKRMEAHNMLKDLNMVDLVLGRLSSETSQDTTREDVVECLQEASQMRAH